MKATIWLLVGSEIRLLTILEELALVGDGPKQLLM